MPDWTRPLRMVPRPDVDGGTYGPYVELRAMLTDTGTYVPLSSRRVDRDTQQHFRDQFKSGVRFMVSVELARTSLYEGQEFTLTIGEDFASFDEVFPEPEDLDDDEE